VEPVTSGRKLPALSSISWRPPIDVVRIVILWAAWLTVICAFQITVQARVQPARPDNVLAWTANETSDGFPKGAGPGCRPYLADPNMNEHVAFDSEYYISIAVGGYDNPQSVAYVSADGHVANAGVPVCNDGLDGWTPLNYAFMPAYPMAMQPVMAVEQHLPFTSDMTAAGQATLAGIIVSSFGGLLAMLALARMMAFLGRRRKTVTVRQGASALKAQPKIAALWAANFAVDALMIAAGYLTQHPETMIAGGILALISATYLAWFLERGREPAADEASIGPWGGTHGLRTALYLLVFPTGFYLAQVYTEGLFIGLAFMACALAVEKKLVGAAIFAALAALTRQAGIFLFLPIAWASFQILRDKQIRPKNWRIAVPIVTPFVPIAAFLGWFFSPLGRNWEVVEHEFFGRSLDIPRSIGLWHTAWDSLITGNDTTGSAGYQVWGGGPLASSTTVYIALEFIALALAIVACIWLLRRMPGVALFGIGVIIISAGSAGSQGMVRYVLAVPAIFLMLAWYGRREVFDRAWVLASTLVMGMLVMVFTFGFWVS
jgi:hypothetical protein